MRNGGLDKSDNNRSEQILNVFCGCVNMTCLGGVWEKEEIKNDSQAFDLSNWLVVSVTEMEKAVGEADFENDISKILFWLY